MKKIVFRAWFPKAQKMIEFGAPEMCDEYDSLSFPALNCTEKYQWLAGESGIPNEPFELNLYTDDVPVEL